MTLSAPPDPFDPLVDEWEAARALFHVHRVGFGALEFNATPSSARFRPLVNKRDNVVPTMYCAADSDAALSETVFHSVPRAASRRRIPYARLLERVISTIEPTRTLRLAQLHGFGLGRLGTTRRELIETGRRSYPATAPWGQAVYDHVDELDGIVWMSRQFDSSKALMLFGDRLAFGDLVERTGEVVIPLSFGRGYEMVADAANRARIDIVRR